MDAMPAVGEVAAVASPPEMDVPILLQEPATDVSGFLVTPKYDLQQIGEIFTGPGANYTLPANLYWSLPKLGSEQSDCVAKAKKYAMEQSIKVTLMKQMLTHQQQQRDRQSALQLMCRVYVGNISFELKEDTIRQSFLPFGPIKSISMSYNSITQKHKGFAFVEYEIAEAAQLSLEHMDGANLGGRNIKVVGRISNVPYAQVIVDKIHEEAKRYNRIYIANIHTDLTEDDIKSVFDAFGRIIFCEFAYFSSTHRHKRYGFIEYETMQSALEAIESMNSFDLGGLHLRVRWAITPPYALMEPATNYMMPKATAVAAAIATTKIQAMDTVASNVIAMEFFKSCIRGLAAVEAATSMQAMPIIPAIPPTVSQIMDLKHHLGGGMSVYPSVSPVIPPSGIALPHPKLSTTLPSVPVLPPPPDLAAQAQLALTSNTIAQRDAIRGIEVTRQQEQLQSKLLTGAENQTLQQQEHMCIRGQSAHHLVMQRLIKAKDSRVVILNNMVGSEVVYQSLGDEIREECGKFGRVGRLIIYNERQSDAPPNCVPEVIVKIFVEFSAMSEAEAAIEALNGRYFGGRTIRAGIYDQDLFDHGDLSG